MTTNLIKKTLSEDINQRGIKDKYYHHTYTEPNFIFEVRGTSLTSVGVNIIADIYFYKENKVIQGRQIELSKHYCDYNLSEDEVNKIFRNFRSTISILENNLKTAIGRDKRIEVPSGGWYSLDDVVINKK